MLQTFAVNVSCLFQEVPKALFHGDRKEAKRKKSGGKREERGERKGVEKGGGGRKGWREE